MKPILASIGFLAVLACSTQAQAQCRLEYRHHRDGLAIVATTLGVLNLVVQPPVEYYAVPAQRYYPSDTDYLLYGGRYRPAVLRPARPTWR